MKKYISFFRIRFFTGLQYRLVMLSALTTQVFWGLLEVLAYYALWQSEAVAFPMRFQSVVTYIWLKEALLALFNTWNSTDDGAEVFLNGNITYEMCRPLSLYGMWFSRALAGRLAEAFLRSIPVLLVAILLPAPFGIGAPCSFPAFLLFLVTLFLGLFVTLSFCILVNCLCFFTISPKGWRMILTGSVDLFSGHLLPLPFFLQPFRTILECLPFAAMNNVPYLIYSGELSGAAMLRSIGLQIFWLIVLIFAGEIICLRAQHRVVVQGG